MRVCMQNVEYACGRRYKEVVETVLRFKDSKEKQIRRAVMVLLPRLAAFSPERFAAEYLGRALTYLIAVLKHQPERYGALPSRRAAGTFYPVVNRVPMQPTLLLRTLSLPGQGSHEMSPSRFACGLTRNKCAFAAT